MNFGTSAVTGAALFAAAALGAAYSPSTADKIWPGGGDRARQVRALLPPVILARLDENLPAQVKAVLPPDGGAPAVAAKDPAPPAAAPIAPEAPPKPAAPAAPPRPPVSVVATVAAKKPVAVRIDAIGTAVAMNTVTLRSRVDTQIEKVLVADGALAPADLR